ncbi:MAG: autotransporter outer membrane beta-barrel domain-containing protein [Parvibaculaceae bacterium]
MSAFRNRLLCFFLCSFWLAQQAALADVEQQDQFGKNTKPKLEIAPYLWAPTIEGRLNFGEVAVNLSLPPVELASDLNGGFMGAGRLTKDNAFLIGEALWLDYENEAFEPFFNQEVHTQLGFAQVAAGWRFDQGGHRWTLAPYVGVQHVNLTSDIRGSLGSLSLNEQWTSPAIGGIAEAHITSRLSLSAKADYADHFSDGRLLSLFGVVNYAFSEDVTVSLGYRWAEGKLKGAEDFVLDLDAAGPVAGVRWQVF